MLKSQPFCDAIVKERKLMIKMEQLYYLTEVAKRNSINKTAEKLFMTSAAISTSIKQMEKECGFEILERTYRGVKLTDQGKQVEKIAEQILALHNEILKIGTKEKKEDQPYLLVIDRQCLKLLAQKIVAPGAKVLDYFKINEVYNIQLDFEKYLTDSSVVVLILKNDERERFESCKKIKMRYLYGSKSYPVSCRNTKWVKPNRTKISKEEFAKLPKIQMRSPLDSMIDNVVLSTDDAAIYAEAIINDYGVGVITKFAPDIYTINHDEFKVYEPFDDEIYIVAITNAQNDGKAMNLLETLIKN